MTKLLMSFISAALGWASGFLFYIGYMTLMTSWGRPTDVEAVLYWTGIFVAVAWLLVVLPFIFLVDESSRLFRLPTAVLVGALGRLASFMVLVGWWTGLWREGLYLGYALVVGASTGGSYASFLRLRRSHAKGAA